MHGKVRALHDFLQRSQVISEEHSRRSDSFVENIDWLVQLLHKSRDLTKLLGDITTNNQLLELILSKTIPSLQIDPKSRPRRLRRMESPEYRARHSGNLLYHLLPTKWLNCVVPHRASMF
jgi:hypothetical protein